MIHRFRLAASPRRASLAFSLFFAFAAPVFAADAGNQATVSQATHQAEVRQTWKMLDYLAVDYEGAVAGGQVTSEPEFAEMTEFAATAQEKIQALPAHSGKDDLLAQAAQLQAAIAAHRDPPDVARIAHGLADALLAAYPVPVAPAKTPDIARGVVVFREKCSVCHGLTGLGDGPAAVNLNPKPVAFAEHERARQRSLFSYFEIVTQGVADTPMVTFEKALSEEDRWAVAFRVGNFAYTDAQRQEGEKLWQQDEAVRAKIPNLESLTRASEATLAEDIGAEKAAAVIAYLRSAPNVVAGSSAGGLALARARLAESVKSYQAGDAKRAASQALSAYLDGFEPVEAALRVQDDALLARIEGAMGHYRSQIAAGVGADVIASEAKALEDLFNQTETALAGANDSTSAFLGAFTILVREGVEALLVVVAMIGFLRKVERRDDLRYVHAGWIAALLLGVATWAVAAYFIDISGANREMTEGFSSLFAALILLAVGIWMHGKSLAGQWQAYIKERMSAALNRSSAIFLFFLAFIAVYREVFETILFYVALWTRGNSGAILGGLAAGVAVLAVIAFVLLRTSRRLPIGTFFAWSSALIAILAIVLTGKGVAALQEAGLLPVIAVNAPRIDALGIYPSAIGLSLQLAVIACAGVGFYLNTRKSRG